MKYNSKVTFFFSILLLLSYKEGSVYCTSEIFVKSFAIKKIPKLEKFIKELGKETCSNLALNSKPVHIKFGASDYSFVATVIAKPLLYIGLLFFINRFLFRRTNSLYENAFTEKFDEICKRLISHPYSYPTNTRKKYCSAQKIESSKVAYLTNILSPFLNCQIITKASMTTSILALAAGEELLFKTLFHDYDYQAINLELQKCTTLEKSMRDISVKMRKECAQLLPEIYRNLDLSFKNHTNEAVKNGWNKTDPTIFTPSVREVDTFLKEESKHFEIPAKILFQLKIGKVVSEYDIFRFFPHPDIYSTAFLKGGAFKTVLLSLYVRSMASLIRSHFVDNALKHFEQIIEIAQQLRELKDENAIAKCKDDLRKALVKGLSLDFSASTFIKAQIKLSFFRVLWWTADLWISGRLNASTMYYKSLVWAMTRFGNFVRAMRRY